MLDVKNDNNEFKNKINLVIPKYINLRKNLLRMLRVKRYQPKR